MKLGCNHVPPFPRLFLHPAPSVRCSRTLLFRALTICRGSAHGVCLFACVRVCVWRLGRV